MNFLPTSKRMLQKLKETNLKLFSSKCSLFRSEIIYVERIISTGVRTDSQKISAVRNLESSRRCSPDSEFLEIMYILQKIRQRLFDDHKVAYKLTEANQKFI